MLDKALGNHKKDEGGLFIDEQDIDTMKELSI